MNLASRVLYQLEVIYTELSSASRLSGIFSEALCFSVFSQWTASGCSMPSTVTFSCFILSIISVLSATPCILHLFSGLRLFPLKNIPAQYQICFQHFLIHVSPGQIMPIKCVFQENHSQIFDSANSSSAPFVVITSFIPGFI